MRSKKKPRANPCPFKFTDLIEYKGYVMCVISARQDYMTARIVRADRQYYVGAWVKLFYLALPDCKLLPPSAVSKLELLLAGVYDNA